VSAAELVLLLALSAGELATFVYLVLNRKVTFIMEPDAPTQALIAQIGNYGARIAAALEAAGNVSTSSAALEAENANLTAQVTELSTENGNLTVTVGELTSENTTLSSQAQANTAALAAALGNLPGWSAPAAGSGTVTVGNATGATTGTGTAAVQPAPVVQE
jgi:hypothetical protein